MSTPTDDMEKKYRMLLGVNLTVIAAFAAWYLSRGNIEFIIFVSVIILALTAVWFTRTRVAYPMPLLWALSGWAFFHMLGGALFIGETRLYDFIFVPLVGEPYHILKFDQLIHTYGFAVSTFVCFYLMRSALGENLKRNVGLAMVLGLAGLGAGAVNEIIEFLITVVSPESGIGGYVNNSLDLIANGMGSAGAAIWIYFNVEKL